MSYRPILGLAGLGWILWGLLEATSAIDYSCDSASGFLRDALLLAAALTLAAGVIALSRSVNRTSSIPGFALAFGAAALGFGNLAEHCAAEELWVLFVLGGLAVVTCGLGLRVALILSREYGLFAGVILAAGALSFVVAGGLAIGGAFFGLSWLIFAWFARPRVAVLR